VQTISERLEGGAKKEEIKELPGIKSGGRAI
jgi:hypothetical protein